MNGTFENSPHTAKSLFGYMYLVSGMPEDIQKAMTLWAEAFVPNLIRSAFCTGALTAMGACGVPRDKIDNLTDWSRRAADGIDFTFEIEDDTIMIYMVSAESKLIVLEEDDK